MMPAMAVVANSSHAAEANEEARDLEQLRATIGPLPEPSANPALVVFVGPPGCGKTTIARAVHERTPVVVVDADEIRHTLFDVPDYSFRESQRVDRAIRSLIGELLAAKMTVLLDDSNLTEWERQSLYTLASRRAVRLVIIEVTAPARVVVERLRHIAVKAPGDTADLEAVYARMAGRQEPIARPHLRVDTSKDTGQFVEELVSQLEAAG
jgi:predicted kinase